MIRKDKRSDDEERLQQMLMIVTTTRVTRFYDDSYVDFEKEIVDVYGEDDL